MTRRDTGRPATLERSDSRDRTERAPPDDRTERSEDRGALVGGDDGCDHSADALTYLGQMGTAAFYRCPDCGGAIVRW